MTSNLYYAHQHDNVVSCLARDAIRSILAVAVRLASGDRDIIPGPVGASARAADDDNVVAGAGHGAGAGDVAEGKVGDWDAAGGLAAVEVAAVVVLLDEDAVLRDARQRDVLVRDAGDGARLVLDGLDADAVDRIGDGGAREGHRVDGVVTAAADGADGETVAAGAGARLEGDVLTHLLVIELCEKTWRLRTVPELTATQSSWL